MEGPYGDPTTGTEQPDIARFLDLLKIDSKCTYTNRSIEGIKPSSTLQQIGQRSFSPDTPIPNLDSGFTRDIISITCRIPVLMAPSLHTGEGSQLLSLKTGGIWNGKRSEIHLDVRGTQPSWSYIFSLCMALAAATVLAYCFAIRTYQVRNFRALPLVRWCK